MRWSVTRSPFKQESTDPTLGMCLYPSGSLKDFMSVTFQPAPEHVAIVGIVIDDKNEADE